jgi:hypothetical protein
MTTLSVLRLLPEFNGLLLGTATAWQAKWKDDAGRIAMGRDLAASGAITTAGPDAFDVVGSGANWYRVTVREGFPSCQCADFKKRAHRCKHIWGCALVARVVALLEEQLAPEEPPPACGAAKVRRPRRPLASQMERHCAKLHHLNAQLNAQINYPEQLSIQRC